MAKKNLLVAVTGIHPQVVTETLYGIIMSKPEEGFAWPDEIKIITTQKGKESVTLGIITPKDDGITELERLCGDYNKPLPKLTTEDVLVIPDSEGLPVEDARTREDQEALADFIVSTVAEFRNNESYDQLHASIAGGRKTMTFFLGYALSLFANKGDKLSHVLVESEYESSHDFYYPTPYTKVIKTKHNTLIDAKQATVMLADIPFVRQRNTLLKSKSLESLSTRKYKDLVKFQNAISDIQNITMEVDYNKRCVNVLDEEIDFSQNKLELAFIGMLARHVKNNDVSAIYAPKKDERASDFVHLSELFYQELERMAGIDVQSYIDEKLNVDMAAYRRTWESRALYLSTQDLMKANKDDALYSLLLEIRHCEDVNDKADKRALFDKLFEQKVADGGITIAKTLLETEGGLTHGFFQDRKTDYKKLLLKTFTPDVVEVLTPEQVYKWEDVNTRKTLVRRDYHLDKTKKQGTPYGFWLESDNITFV